MTAPVMAPIAEVIAQTTSFSRKPLRLSAPRRWRPFGRGRATECPGHHRDIMVSGLRHWLSLWNPWQTNPLACVIGEKLRER
jgi:hypothetical protein